MKAFPWIIAGVTIGTVITYIALHEPSPQYATGSETIEGVAQKASVWGTKQRTIGKVNSIAGATKRGLGRMTGDTDLIDEGAAEGVLGDVKDAAGKVADAAGQTIHDLNI
jgi:uncharacterized protein YjbJ (UPF0337 family)